MCIYIYIYIRVIYVHLLVQIINNKKDNIAIMAVFTRSVRNINTLCRQNLKFYINIYIYIFI